MGQFFAHERWHDFRHLKWVRRANRALQMALLLTLLFGINQMASRHYIREDLSDLRVRQLSPETVGYLRQLQRPVEVIVTIPRNSTSDSERLLFRYTKEMLDEYERIAQRDGGAMIKVEYLDIFRDHTRAAALATEFDLSIPYMVLFKSGESKKAIRPTDIMEVENDEPVAFKGENAFTSALLEVSTGKRKLVYFLAGHGEMALDDADPRRGLSQLKLELASRNYLARTLDISQVDEVPAETLAVFAVDPQGALLPIEQDRLKRYLRDRSGQLAVLISPTRKHGYDDLFFEWGIQADDRVIFERGPDYIQSSGSLILRNYGEHPITRNLIKQQIPILASLCRPVRPDPGAPLDQRLKITPFIGSSATSWGELDYNKPGTPTFNPEYDIAGPVPIATAAEKIAASQLGISLEGGKLVVMGSGTIFSNQNITSPGNLSLFLSMLDWFSNRENTINAPPRPISKVQISLSGAEQGRLAIYYLIAPGITLLLGVAVWWLRRG